MIYLFILIFTIVLSVLYDFLEIKKNWKLWYIVELIIFILLAGLRFRVGADSLDYLEFFEDYPKLDELAYFDFQGAPFNPLWYIYNAIIKSIYDNFIFFQIIQAIIVNSVFFWFFKKYTNHFFTAIVIYYAVYYLYFNLEIEREILSICIFMLSFDFLIKKKYIVYILFFIVALSIHFSALIMAVVPLFLLIPKINWKIALSIFVLLILFLNIYDINPLLSNILTGNEKMIEKFMTYSMLDDHTLNINGIIAYLLPIILLIYANGKIEGTEINAKMQNLLVIYILLIGLSIYIPAMFSRMQNYLEPFYIIYIVNSLFSTLKNSTLKEKINSYFVKFAILFFLFISYKSYTVDCSKYMLGTKSYNLYYPYHSIFDPIIEADREKFVEIYKQGDLY